MSDPRTEGARAYRSGEDREDNPYDRVSETEDYYEWLDGFNESEFSGSADDEGEDEPSGEVPDDY